ncbi:SOS response-associated peptidase [Marivivens sp. JLT3646]|uniref:SOS response-associated peptidase n=1 Tax=Marivivens sp. JLT3646 TaxID=1920883 RepID=UPI001E5D10E6|nr:SOS response-associated peptidase [Marivivens sp. JLT3646]
MAITLPHDAMAQMFSAAKSNTLPSDEPNWNVCPTTTIAAVTSHDNVRHLRPMRWGFIPTWYDKPNGGPLLINARAETIAEKPAFHEACRHRRCLIAADGFYEWHRDGDTPLPYWVTRTDGAPMVFGGIWQNWGDQATCAIVTTDANADMAPIHHRLPLILPPDDWALWLGEAGHGAAKLMTPAKEGVLSLRRVSKAVNSNRATGPELIEPLIEDE